ncbi:MAG: carboxypeptidase regulatory-like domain-containing protein [Acidobacteria bacterium]|nr:carboxypeptidase regulatory-like domain-containing protein [Acidobacteriota bacterium]
MRLFQLGLCICLGTSLASAQDTRGAISGTVTDSQKAAIAGAAVIIANTGTGTSTKLVTNGSGYYEAPFLIAGDYRITVENAGFKKSVRSGITVGIGDRLQIDVQMEVGGTTESVTVTSEAPMLDTNSVTTGRSMTHREIMDLPVLGNNISMLARIAPGVQVPGTTQFLVQGQVGGGSAYSAPGGVGGNEWSMDGASTNGTDRRTAIMPSPDIVDEFKIETSNFDASFGHSTGLNVSMSTKAGTNGLHGSATYQYFNQRWNAASFFVKQSRWAQVATLRNSGKFAEAEALADSPMLPAGHTNNYHGTVSGPVVIPKIVDGRNKLFFFLGYSGLKNKQAARPSEINYTVPTVAMRNGDFSQLLQVAVSPARYQVYDPLTTRPDPARPGHVVRTPFAGNILPRARMQNPMYDFYTKRMPLPNNDPASPALEPLNNYLATGMPNNVTYSSWNNRIDYQATGKHRFFFRWLKSSYLEDAQDYTYETEPGLMAWNEKRPSKTAAVDWTYTISSSTVMNVSVDATQFLIQNQRLGTRKYKPSDAGLPSYMDAKCASSCVMPRVNWIGMPYWGDANQSIMSTNVDPGPIGRQQALKYNVTHIRGSHSLRAGIDFRQHYRTNIQNGGFTSGQFSFANTYVRKDEDGFNAAGTLGLSWATFALGIPTGMSVDTNDTFALMNPYYGWYGQDTWRVTRNLSLTYGLRMEYELGPAERYNRAIASFDPALTLPITAAAQAAYAANPLPEVPASQFIVKGGNLYAGANGADRRLWRNELMWLPRLSAAYSLNSKTVLRGGYGIYYDTLNALNQGPDQYGYSRTTNTVLTNDFGQTWRAGDPANGVSPLRDPFPVRADGTRFDTPFKNGLGEMARVGQGFTYTDYNRQHPRVQRWRVGVQRELGSNMILEASYWGQWGDRIFVTSPTTLKEDPLPQSYWATGNVRNNAIATELNRQIPNPFYIGNFASLQSSNPLLYQQLSTLGAFQSTTVAKNRLLRQFPQMNGLNNNSSPAGKARTNAFEFNFQRRMSKGFNLNLSYTRMYQSNKTIFENEFNTEPTIFWPSDTARPHRLTGTAIIELPFGKGRAMFQTGILNHILGGWQTALTYEFQNGPLLAWGNNFYYGDINSFETDATSTAKTLNQWFNTGLQFERNANNQPAAFHTRIFPRYFNGLRADGLNQWNGNLLREFKVVERMRLQFRADIINLQNRSQMNPPELNATSTNFGRVTSQTSSLNRFYQVQMRLQF